MTLRAGASFTAFDCDRLFPVCDNNDFDDDFDDDFDEPNEPSEVAKNLKCRSNFLQMKLCESYFAKELRKLNEQSIQVKPPVRKSASKKKEDACKAVNTFRATSVRELLKVTPAAVETCDDLETEEEAISVAPPALGLVKTIVAEIDARTAVVGACSKDTLIMNFTDDSRLVSKADKAPVEERLLAKAICCMENREHPVQNKSINIDLANLATTGAFTSQQVRLILRAVMSSSDDAPAINVQVAPVFTLYKHNHSTISL